MRSGDCGLAQSLWTNGGACALMTRWWQTLWATRSSNAEWVMNGINGLFISEKRGMNPGSWRSRSHGRKYHKQCCISSFTDLQPWQNRSDYSLWVFLTCPSPTVCVSMMVTTPGWWGLRRVPLWAVPSSSGTPDGSVPASWVTTFPTMVRPVFNVWQENRDNVTNKNKAQNFFTIISQFPETIISFIKEHKKQLNLVKQFLIFEPS